LDRPASPNGCAFTWSRRNGEATAGKFGPLSHAGKAKGSIYAGLEDLGLIHAHTIIGDGQLDSTPVL
jgi:hypothetical protein